MTNDFYIFDIPIYRCDEKKFDNDLNAAVSDRRNIILNAIGAFKEDVPDTYRNIEENKRREFGGPWDFNQIIGWLRLFAESYHVGGHLWWVNKRKIHRVIKYKMFYLLTPSDLLGNYFTHEDVDSELIYRSVLTDIEDLSRQHPKIKGRYINLELFKNIGPFINWSVLLSGKQE